ncbi:MAG: TIGR01459 family HAD-type hydrolase [Alphaproteobacteria bacterium]|nr:TIGR01459 family HAD-type hydrolase [Alphaproteobacteria bacterium]
MSNPQILPGLSAIAGDYDALICDVWGVIHNGKTPYPAACEALRRFRETRGKVVLLTNAPRPPGDIVTMFDRLGVPHDCYDSIVTSGFAAREDMEKRIASGLRAFYHLGPDRDRGVFEGLAAVATDVTQADVVLCTGLFNDETEAPDDYAEIFAAMRARDLTMLCANPDIRVPRGDRLIWCAGALAQAYEKLGGQVVYYGKPHGPIYRAALAQSGGAKRPLAIGDGLKTDVLGANRAGLDVLFVAGDLHAEELGTFSPENLSAMLSTAGVSAVAAMPALVW